MRKIIFSVLIVFCISANLVNAKGIKMINFKNLADMETKIWQSYYKGDSDALLKNMKVFIIEQYGISDSEKAEEAAKKLVLGYKTFATMPQFANPEEYSTSVLPLLVVAYQALKQSINASWDPQKAAVADLSWMVARRQDSTLDPEIVAKKMAVLFCILYGQQENYHFIRAAYLRSVAGRYRDQCQDAWGGVSSEDWKVVNSLLKNAYKELCQGLKTSQRKFPCRKLGL
jgi:hypothetical protein